MVTMRNLSGTHYTPSVLASFMVSYVCDNMVVENSADCKVLEPSFGGGVFLDALAKHSCKEVFKVNAIEIDTVAVDSYLKPNLLKSIDLEVFNEDYLDWCTDDKNRREYDLIIGNPPYISKKYLSEKQKNNCKKIHSQSPGFGSEVHNIWTSFLSDAVNRLTDNGVIAFVLPAEFLKVKFGEPIQRSLMKEFKRIEVFTFSTRVFPNIEQDTIILFLFKSSDNGGLYFTDINSSKCLLKRKFRLIRKRSLESLKLKWSAYPLLEKQIKEISQAKKRLSVISDFCETNPGIVTAANDYFIVNKETVESYQLEAISHPVIQKGAFVNGCVTLTKDKLNALINEGKPAFFLDFSKIDLSNKKHKEYIQLGENREIHKRYKCKLRDTWYEVPGAWISEGFFFKRCHEYPKLIFNDADVLVTDSSYRIKMKDGYDIRSLIFSFYNSLTLAISEIQGRYYGGGVLELTPSEFKSLPIPYKKIDNATFEDFAEQFHKKRSIEEILAHNDEILLVNHLKMNESQIESLRTIRTSLMSRRLKISKSRFN